MGIGAEQAEEVRREGRNCRMAMQISIAKKPNRGKSKAASKAMQEGDRAEHSAWLLKH